MGCPLAKDRQLAVWRVVDPDAVLTLRAWCVCCADASLASLSSAVRLSIYPLFSRFLLLMSRSSPTELTSVHWQVHEDDAAAPTAPLSRQLNTDDSKETTDHTESDADTLAHASADGSTPWPDQDGRNTLDSEPSPATDSHAPATVLGAATGGRASFRAVASARFGSTALSMRAWVVSLLLWLSLLFPLGCLIGVASACFLASIDITTKWRFSYPWLLYLLPLSGLMQSSLYHLFARVTPGSSAYGVDFVIEQVHSPNARKGRAHVPWRMGWLAWLGTCLSHVCGASVGREGTGLQLAASIGGWYASMLRRLSRGRVKLGRHKSRLLTIASMAAGFSGVFGTPFAGVVFSLEVLSVGSLSTQAFLPCLIASCTADLVASEMMDHMGVHHSAYPLNTDSHRLRWGTLLLIFVAALLFGAVARAFSEAVHLLQRFARWLLPGLLSLLIPVLGGALVILLVFLFRTRDYLGIGTIRAEDETPPAVIIASCFYPAGDAASACHQYSFVLKWIFTVLSLAFGFKGGEVTSLFYIGASCGFSAAVWLGVPADTDLFASVGFVSVFAAAANTPLASTLMACELFGGTHVAYYAVGCFTAYVASGQAGIYKTQKRDLDKMETGKETETPQQSKETVATLHSRVP